MNVPYWLQLVIYPIIKGTDCHYCMFLRGFAIGVAAGLILGGTIVWAVLSR